MLSIIIIRKRILVDVSIIDTTGSNCLGKITEQRPIED